MQFCVALRCKVRIRLHPSTALQVEIFAEYCHIKRKDHTFFKFMFTNHPILDNFDYICAQNAQCWARITKIYMEIQRYNRLKIVLAEKERTGTWLSEQMGHSISTVSRWMTNKVEPTCGKFDLVARLSENSTRLHTTSMWM